MAESRRPGESLRSFVERQIREAQAEGAFERLERAGRPLPFVDKPHDPMWWWKDKLERERLSFLPESMTIHREAETVLQGLAVLGSEDAVRQRLEELNGRIRKVNRTASSGPPTSLAPVDVEAAVRRWREGRERAQELELSAASAKRPVRSALLRWLWRWPRSG
jgi:hypothetical protein